MTPLEQQQSQIDALERILAKVITLMDTQAAAITQQTALIEALYRQQGLPAPSGPRPTPWGTSNISGKPTIGPAPANPPKPPAWVPTFEGGHFKLHVGEKFPMPEKYYADAATAEEVRRRINGASVTVAQPSDYRGVEDPTVDPQRFVVMTDGFRVNAGVLAAVYLRYPDDAAPGAGDKAALELIEEARKTK